MDLEQIDQVYDAIREHGDDFWNDATHNENNWNGYLFREIITMLQKNGLDLRLVKMK